VNNINKILKALQSRLLPICFDVEASDRAEVKAKLEERYVRVMEDRDVTYDRTRLVEIIGIHYPIFGR
jgi:hypothetical protein